MGIKSLLFVLCCLLSEMIFAQVETRSGGWSNFVGTLHIKGNWSVNLDLVLRTSDQWQYIQTAMVKPGINYRFSNLITAFLGYNNVHSRVTIDQVSGYITEHQVWQQLFIRHKLFNRLNTLHRPLVEELVVDRALRIDADDQQHVSKAAWRQ